MIGLTENDKRNQLYTLEVSRLSELDPSFINMVQRNKSVVGYAEKPRVLKTTFSGLPSSTRKLNSVPHLQPPLTLNTRSLSSSLDPHLYFPSSAASLDGPGGSLMITSQGTGDADDELLKGMDSSLSEDVDGFEVGRNGNDSISSASSDSTYMVRRQSVTTVSPSKLIKQTKSLAMQKSRSISFATVSPMVKKKRDTSMIASLSSPMRTVCLQEAPELMMTRPSLPDVLSPKKSR